MYLVPEAIPVSAWLVTFAPTVGSWVKFVQPVPVQRSPLKPVSVVELSVQVRVSEPPGGLPFAGLAMRVRVDADVTLGVDMAGRGDAGVARQLGSAAATTNNVILCGGTVVVSALPAKLTSVSRLIAFALVSCQACAVLACA